MKKFLSILRDIAFVIFVLAICGMIFIMSTGKHVSIAGYQVLRVLTSSMEPAIAENTCIIIKEYPVDQLKVGDIITFTSDDPQIQGYYNTHRIHDIVEENGETLFVTKGDATSAVDAYPVHKDQVAGIFVKELPGGRTLGKMFLALSDNKVYFLVIMLPLALCLISYFWQIVGMVTGRYDEEEEVDYKVIVNEMDELDEIKGYPVMEQVSQMKEASNVGEISGAEGNSGKEEISGAEGNSGKEEISGVEGNSGKKEISGAEENFGKDGIFGKEENPGKEEVSEVEGISGKTRDSGVNGNSDKEEVSEVEEISGQTRDSGVGGVFGKEEVPVVEEISGKAKITDVDGVFGENDTFGIKGTFEEAGSPSVEEYSGIERNNEIERKLQTEKMSENINTIISDSEIEAILAEAASKIEDSKIEDVKVEPEKARIDRIVEELTSNSVSEELVREKREKLKADYKKINKNYSKSGSE